MPAADDARKGEIMGDFAVFLLVPAIQDFLHPFPGRAIDERLMNSVVGLASILKLTGIDALAQDFMQCGDRDSVPTETASGITQNRP